MFAIVQFQKCHGGTISIVARDWLTPRKSEVYWPPVKGSKAFERLLHNQEASPDDKWKLYGIERILCETDNIDIAKRKLKLAEVTSDLQTEEEEDEKPKRKAVRTTRFDSSDEDDEFNHLRPPPLKKQFVDALQNIMPVSQLSKKQVLQELNQEVCPTPSTSNSVTVAWPISSTPENATGTSNELDITSLPTLSTSVLQNLEQDVLSLNGPITQGSSSQNPKLSGFQERVVTLLTHIKTQNDQILTILSQKSGQENVQSDFEFPIKTLEALDATEELLQNKTKYDNLVSYLKTLGGRDTSSRVNYILKKVLSENVAIKFNFYGHRSNKKAFHLLRLRGCIVEAVKRSGVGATDKDIEDCIKNWLKHAPERLKKVKKS